MRAKSAGGRARGCSLHQSCAQTMLPIAEMPIIEIIARQLFHFGYDRIDVSLGHLSGVIEYFLKSIEGEEGVPEFEFFTESIPLGTSGPVKAINPGDDDFLVINGDIYNYGFSQTDE